MNQIKQGYKKTKFGYIPNEWRIDSFSKVIKPIVREVEKPNKPYWRLGLRSHGKGTFHEFIEDPNSVSMDKLYIVKENDLIVNITFAWEQAIALAAKKDENKLVSHRFPTYQFTNNNVPLFYKYYVLQPRFKYELENISPGGAGRNRVMNKTDFLKIDVLIPLSKEQEKIAEILTTWDEAITKQTELLEAKELLKKALMQKLLSGEVRFSGFSGEWEEVRLGEIGEFKTSSIDKIINKNEKLVNLVNYMDVYRNKHIDKNFKCSETSLKEEQYEKANLKKGDILFTPSSETPDDIGHSAVITEDLTNTVYSYHLVRFRPKKKIDINFSGYVFNNVDILKEFARKATGSTRFTLSIKDFNEIRAKLPSLPEQQKIAEVLSLADKEINLLKNSLEELKLQKKALMQKLLTGEVRVKV